MIMMMTVMKMRMITAIILLASFAKAVSLRALSAKRINSNVMTVWINELNIFLVKYDDENDERQI